MNKVKYQIFVSSTYDDLKEERDQVIKACLEMGHIPVGMEMFSAADEEQWQIITRQIDESDYYVIIVANRYGSMVDGISYTEKEYDYAISKGVPTLGFVLDSKAAWPSNRAETDKKALTKLEAFKKKVKGKPVNFWTSKEDLHGKCAIALGKTFNTQPRPGWVRSPEATGPEVAAELSRLSSLNAKLIEENTALRKTADTSGFAQGDDQVELAFELSFNDKGALNKASLTLFTAWNDLFKVIAKKALNDPLQASISVSIAYYHTIRLAEAYHSVSYNDISSMDRRNTSVYLTDQSLDVIKIQLLALGLIKVNFVQGAITWILTPLGEQQYITIAALKRE